MNAVPTVEAVFRYPVKSMLGTRVEQAEVRASGLVGDRGWALVNLQTGKVASAKRPRLWRSLLQLRAEYHGGSGCGDPAGAVTVTLPDGTAVGLAIRVPMRCCQGSLGARWPSPWGVRPAPGLTGRCPKKCSPTAPARK